MVGKLQSLVELMDKQIEALEKHINDLKHVSHTLKSLKNNGENNSEKIIIRFVNRKNNNEILKN